MDLALNNLQRLICHKTHPNNLLTNQPYRTFKIYLLRKDSNGLVLRSGNLLSFLLRCGTRPYERGTQWDWCWEVVHFSSTVKLMSVSVTRLGSFIHENSWECEKRSHESWECKRKNSQNVINQPSLSKRILNFRASKARFLPALMCGFVCSSLWGKKVFSSWIPSKISPHGSLFLIFGDK